MTRIVINLPAEFEQVTAPLEPGDELLTVNELVALSVFKSL
jgi:hypothetical protein